MRLLVFGTRDWYHEPTIRCEVTAMNPSFVVSECNDPMGFAASTLVPDDARVSVTQARRAIADHAVDALLVLGPLWRRGQPGEPTDVQTAVGEVARQAMLLGVPVRWVSAPGTRGVELVTMPQPGESR